MANDWVFTHDDDDNIEYWYRPDTWERAIVYRDGMTPLYQLSAEEVAHEELAGPPGSPGLFEVKPGVWRRMMEVEEDGGIVYKIGQYEAFYDPIGDFHVLHSDAGNGNIQIVDLAAVCALLNRLYVEEIQRSDLNEGE